MDALSFLSYSHPTRAGQCAHVIEEAVPPVTWFRCRFDAGCGANCPRTFRTRGCLANDRLNNLVSASGIRGVSRGSQPFDLKRHPGFRTPYGFGGEQPSVTLTKNVIAVAHIALRVAIERPTPQTYRRLRVRTQPCDRLGSRGRTQKRSTSPADALCTKLRLPWERACRRGLVP